MQDRAANIALDLSLKVNRYRTITVGNAQEQVGETPTRTRGMPAGQNRKAPPPAAIAGEALVSLTVNSTVIMVPVIAAANENARRHCRAFSASFGAYTDKMVRCVHRIAATNLVFASKN